MKLPTAERRVRLYRGDCLHMMRRMPDDCVTAVVTDPPAGIGFMNREWDDFRRQRNPADSGRDSVIGRLSRSAPQIGRGDLRSMEPFVEFMRERMAEALRVTVPGGLALVWAHPKTEDWTSIACRLAGWERIGWTLHLFAGGMPKGFLSARLAESAGVSTERAKQLMSTFRVPSVEPWLVFRKPSKTSPTANLREHGTGYFPLGDHRVPRRNRPKIEVRGTANTRDANTAAWTMGRSRNVGTTDEGSLPKDVELVCSPECADDEHVEGCSVREIAARGRTGKASTRGRAHGGATNPTFRMDESKSAEGRALTVYGDEGDSSRYFHRHGADAAEEALAVWAPKAKAQLRLSTDPATEKHLRDGWRLFYHEGADLVEWTERREGDALHAFNKTDARFRVRIRSTNERHRWCEHLFWEHDPKSPVGWRRVTYGAWCELPKAKRGHGNVHPTVKAQALVRPLVATATGNVANPLVLDPFGGSGAVAQAALALGCRVITAEQDPIVGWPIITAKLTGLAASGGIGGVDA